MLVLTRKEDQSVTLSINGHHVATVKVCKIDRGRVSIGIDAPDFVHILRDDAKHQPSRRPSASPASDLLGILTANEARAQPTS